MKKKYLLEEITSIKPNFQQWQIIFLFWDLWAWKTTLTKYFINQLLWVKENIISPTYTYYNQYNWILDWEEINIYHFDLYKLSNYDEFFAIWAEEIFDNNDWIIIVEWPEIIKNVYQANIVITIEKTKNDNERLIEILN